MSEVNDWMQSNWYELGSLLVQMGFLVAGVWFARKILRTLRASQEQVGALLKLSVFDANAERPAAAAIVERAGRTEEPALTLPDRAEGGAGMVAARGGFLQWLQGPMESGGATPRGRVMRWLQAPAGS
jgi:hypothetical protein